MKNKKNRLSDQESENFDNNEMYFETYQESEFLNMDYIGTLQDEEIINLLDSMYDGRNTSLKSKVSTVTWEVEICYLRRELQLRRERRIAHETYLKETEVSLKTTQYSEKYLPTADLDNSKFMFVN